MQKTIILMLTLFVISCTNNNYEKLVDEKFKKSKYEDILEKNIEKKTYYKYDYSKKFKQENIFLFIEKEDPAKLYLGINYRGKDWLYMKSIEFIGTEDFEIDFLDYRTFNPIWKDNTTINMGVFTLKKGYLYIALSTFFFSTMEISLKPIVATLSFEEMMSDFFESVESLAKEKRVIVAIDEFQQIAEIKDIKLDAYLRKEIQQRSKNVSYFFLGSKRHLLTSLFEYKAPLYEMARHYELPSLELSEIRDYVTRYIEISDFLLEYVCEICDYETKMLQHMFHILYVRKEDITKETIDRARDEIIGSKDSSYRMVYDSLSSTQKIALKAVGKYKGGFFAQEVLQEYNITKQSMQSAINLLSKKELIDKEGQKYFIPDRVFELWIERL